MAQRLPKWSQNVCQNLQMFGNKTPKCSKMELKCIKNEAMNRPCGWLSGSVRRNPPKVRKGRAIWQAFFQQKPENDIRKRWREFKQKKYLKLGPKAFENNPETVTKISVFSYFPKCKKRSKLFVLQYKTWFWKKNTKRYRNGAKMGTENLNKSNKCQKIPL